MNPVRFQCVHCHHPLSVRPDNAGKAVRCPKCKAVLVAPPLDPHDAPPKPPSAIPFSRALPETDSIFSDPDDGEGDSLFSGASEARKPILPPTADAAQPTLRVPGIPGPTPPRTSAGSRTAVDHAAGMPTVTVVVPAEVVNPFRRMVDEALTEERPPDDDEPAAPPPARPSAAMTWALVGVSLYAILATAAAVWGWVRPLPDAPAVQSPKR